jgi:cell division septum initiation protein DivIVA
MSTYRTRSKSRAREDAAAASQAAAVLHLRQRTAQQATASASDLPAPMAGEWNESSYDHDERNITLETTGQQGEPDIEHQQHQHQKQQQDYDRKGKYPSISSSVKSDEEQEINTKYMYDKAVQYELWGLYDRDL